jgi:membrane protein DedA with SNARE-associated domain
MYELLQRYGLWAVFFGAMIEGDLTLLFAGVLAKAGLFSLQEALIVGAAGGFIGDSISYFIGARFRNRARTLRFFIKARPRIEKLMRRFGVLTVFIVKYVYGLRTTSAIFWGLAHFGYLKFAMLTLASCGVWASVLVGLGFTFAAGIEGLIGDLHRVQIILLVFIIIIATVYIITRFERRVIEEEKEFFTETDEEKELIAKGKEILNKAMTPINVRRPSSSSKKRNPDKQSEEQVKDD